MQWSLLIHPILYCAYREIVDQVSEIKVPLQSIATKLCGFLVHTVYQALEFTPTHGKSQLLPFHQDSLLEIHGICFLFCTYLITVIKVFLFHFY